MTKKLYKVRCTHVESGAVGKSEDHRSQRQNKKVAFKRMAESCKFKAWLKIETSKKVGKEEEIKLEVEQAMRLKNLKIETKDGSGKWVENKELKCDME